MLLIFFNLIMVPSGGFQLHLPPYFSFVAFVSSLRLSGYFLDQMRVVLNSSCTMAYTSFVATFVRPIRRVPNNSQNTVYRIVDAAILILQYRANTEQYFLLQILLRI